MVFICYVGESSYLVILLVFMLFFTCHFTYSFSELPECQLAIARHPGVLEQIVNIGLSPTYTCATPALTAEVLLCLAHNQSTHQYLANEYVVGGMLQTLRDRPKMVENTSNGALELVGLR